MKVNLDRRSGRADAATVRVWISGRLIAAPELVVADDSASVLFPMLARPDGYSGRKLRVEVHASCSDVADFSLAEHSALRVRGRLDVGKCRTDAGSWRLGLQLFAEEILRA